MLDEWVHLSVACSGLRHAAVNVEGLPFIFLYSRDVGVEDQRATLLAPFFCLSLCREECLLQCTCVHACMCVFALGEAFSS